MDAKRIKLSKENCSAGAVNNIPIRTLYVSPINTDMSDQIKCYFERFGTVNSVDIEQEKNSNVFFALVEFKLAKSAASVLSSKRMHRIDYCRVEVKAAEPWLQPDHILNALDDDCLRMILLKLNLLDLTNAANVCVRFNQQAKSIFSTKFKKLDLVDCTLEAAENSLKTFGSLAQSIDVGSNFRFQGVYEIKILSTIAQYCTSELKEFTFRGFDFESQPSKIDLKFNTAFSKLERLSFIYCHLWDTLNALLSACVELKVLHIQGCRQNRDLSKWPEFGKLQELRLFKNPCLYANFINDIITMNSKLLKISIVCCNTNGSSDTIRTIVQNNPNLLELEFIPNSYENGDLLEIIRCCSHLTSLKVLKLHLNFAESPAAPFKILTASAIPIEQLKLCCGTIDTEAIAGISQMKQLKVLELNHINGLTDEHTIGLAKGLGSQLEKLQLGGSTAKFLTEIGLKKMLPFATKLSLLTLKSKTITIDADDYKAMLATIQKRPKKVSLSIELTGKGGQVRVDETTLVENRNIFYIDEKIDISFDTFELFSDTDSE